MKKNIFTYLSLMALLTIAIGCRPDPNPNPNHGIKSHALKEVEANIDAMGNKPWDKKSYENISENQIDQLKKASEISAAKDHLDATYLDVLKRDTKKILDDGCSAADAHSQLNAMISEMNGKFKENKDVQKINARKADHDRVLRMASSSIANQAVGSIRTTYDSSYETAKMGEAKSLLADSSVKCKITREKLEKLTRPESYTSRRNNFCSAICSLFLSSTNPSLSDLNAALNSLNSAKINTSTWSSRMRNYYNSLNEAQK